MSRASRAKKIAAGVAYGGGGIGAVGAVGGAALLGLVFGETKIAHQRIPRPTTDPPVSDNTIWAAAGVSPGRPPIRIVMLGDSTAAGYGVHRERDTPAAQLAIGISDAARRPVHVTNVAVIGAESWEMAPQLDKLAGTHPDLAVIMVGTNDITARTKPSGAVSHLAEAVTRLRALGAEVVVGTCPDLGTIRPLPQPLRWYARQLSRRLAAAQTIAAVNAGATTVSLGDLLGELFAKDRELFAEDQFHPSAAGYAEAIQALLPSALHALGIRTRTRSASTFTTRRPKPVEKAAVQAAHRPGSEVEGTTRVTRFGRAVGFAQLRRRRPQQPSLTSTEAATAVPAR